MKKLFTTRLIIMGLALSGILFLTNCGDDDGGNPDGPPPTGSFESPINAEPGQQITFTGTVNDELGLTGITMTNDDLGLDGSISLDKELTFEVAYNFTVPETTTDGTYPVSIVVSNTSNKSTTFNVDVVVETVVDIPDDYDAVWVAGGVLWWEWGTPEGNFYQMIKDNENPGWFEIVLQSWEGYNEIKFLGQNAWAPDNWGLVDNTDPNSDMANDENSQTLILPDQGKNPAYYKVRFNPNTLEYNYEEMIPDIEVQETMYIVGKGFTDYPDLDWNPEQAIPMTANPYEYGQHQFLAENLAFSDTVHLKFIGQNDGWGPVDIGFDTDYLTDVLPDEDGWQVEAPINWTPAKSGDGTADLKFYGQAGLYTVYLDYYLQRVVIWKED